MTAKTIHIQYMKTAYGELVLGTYREAEKAALCLCDWRYRKMRGAVDKRVQQRLGASYIEKKDKLNEQAMRELNEYFAGERQKFNIELALAGSEFQQKVWHQLIAIPYGETASYLALAKSMDNEKAIRAVAAANGANAISIIVPCHRIIGSDGKLVGYAGGLQAKQKLLLLENSRSCDANTGSAKQELSQTLALF